MIKINVRDASNMDRSGDNISESGWTMYLDHSSTDKTTANFDIECTSCNKASGIEGKESSMASDASSGPQLLPLPDEEQNQPTYGSYPSRIRRWDGRKNYFDSVSSCSFSDEYPRKCKLPRVDYSEESKHCSWLQDTASSCVQSLESAVLEGKEEQLQDESLVNIEICKEKDLVVAIEYINPLEQRVQPQYDDGSSAEEDSKKYIVKLERGRKR